MFYQYVYVIIILAFLVYAMFFCLYLYVIIEGTESAEVATSVGF